MIGVIHFSVLMTFFPALSPAAVTEVDVRGHVLTLDEPPVRIACLYAFAGHVVTMLGRGEDMTAVVRGLKKDRLLGRILPGIRDVPSPSAGGIIHVESLLKTRPDITFLKPETAGIPEEIQKLDRFNLAYFTAGYCDMNSQMAVIEKMGRIIGRRQRACAYTTYYRSVIDRVGKRTRHLEPDKRVRLYHSINEPFRTDGPGTLEADWTGACNVINVSVTARLKDRKNKSFAGMEQILMWNPDMIIANETDVARLIRLDKKWAPIRAVRDKKVYAIPVGISRWGHPGGLETPLAILWTAKTAYPNLFDDLDLESEIQTFYHDFFNLDLDRSMVNRILSGRGMRLENGN